MPTIKNYMATTITTGMAVVTALLDGERPAVRLNTTLFHPRGGGQPADQGFLVADVAGVMADGAGEAYFREIGRRWIRVLDVRHAEGDEVDHFIDGFAGLGVGNTVMMIVDADVRRLHSRSHSAGHVLADVAMALDPQLHARQGHHWPGEARVEFDGEIGDVEAFTELLNGALAQIVAEQVPIRVLGGPQGPRSVQVGDAPAVGCGGTHAVHTGELTGLCVRRIQSKKGVVKIGYDLA